MGINYAGNLFVYLFGSFEIQNQLVISYENDWMVSR